jgi:hypothetical protein
LICLKPPDERLTRQNQTAYDSLCSINHKEADMTRDEFIKYAHEVLSDEALEPLCDKIMEHNAEVAQFGDSWPGALVEIHASVASVHRIERQLARLEGRQPRDFRFAVRSPR